MKLRTGLVGVHSVSRPASSSDDGSATVELALIVPMLVLIMLGVLDLGRVFYWSISVDSVARAGVGYGSKDVPSSQDIPGMEAAALADADDVAGLDIDAAQVCRCPDQAPVIVACTVPLCSDGTPIRIYAEVTVTGTFTPIIPYPGGPGAITVTRTARMRAQ
jgi:hypothetical protein